MTSNTKNKTKRSSFGIISLMFKLLEQRKIVKWVKDYVAPRKRCKKEDLWVGVIPEEDIVDACFKNHPNKTIKCNEIKDLINDCIKDDFLEKIGVPCLEFKGCPENLYPYIELIKTTKRGRELLTFTRFIEIWLEECPTPKLIVYTLIGTLLSLGGILYIIIPFIKFLINLLVVKG